MVSVLRSLVVWVYFPGIARTRRVERVDVSPSLWTDERQMEILFHLLSHELRAAHPNYISSSSRYHGVFTSSDLDALSHHGGAGRLLEAGESMG